MNLHGVIKVVTGILIVPFAILASGLWPWWTNKPSTFRVLTALFVLPIIAVAAITTPWWDDF